MTTELVTAHAGKNHIGSEDVGALYAGALGSGRFAFDVGEGLAVTMTDANTVRIGTGVFLMDGRQVRVKEAESVKVANGSQGAFRRDLVTYTYKRDPSNGNVEEGSWSVLQGTAAASEAEAKAPDYAAGHILDGDLTATVAVAEVSLSGLAPTAKLLLPSVASLRTLGDSVSLYESTNWSIVRVGLTVYVRATQIIAEPAEGVTCKYTIPEELRPSHAWSAAMVTEYGGGDGSYRLFVMPDGTIRAQSMGGKTDRQNHFASLSYPIGM